MRYIIVDLEATCWKSGRSRDDMEIIEIGAVEMLSADADYSKEFSEFVRPTAEPILSDFCKELTTIKQTEVDRAENFPHVFERFVQWIGAEPFFLCSWGAYDLNQFRSDCRRHKIPFPSSFQRHINVKKQYASLMGVKPCGMKKALALSGIPLSGTHHRGIDDARNIAKLARSVLPCLETSS